MNDNLKQEYDMLEAESRKEDRAVRQMKALIVVLAALMLIGLAFGLTGCERIEFPYWYEPRVG